MSVTVHEDSYAPLLGGVSQQVPHQRVPGQLTEQTNMLSDPQTGLRRRPGTKWLATYNHSGSALTSTALFYAAIGGVDVLVVCDTANAMLRVFDLSGNVLLLEYVPYIAASSSKDIKVAALNGELFVLNTTKIPANATPAPNDNQTKGYFSIEAGQFKMRYQVSLVTSAGFQYNAEYTTPDGTGATDAELASPEYIAGQLANGLNVWAGKVSATQWKNTVFCRLIDGTTATLSVTSSTGGVYMTTSRTSSIRDSSQLPATLHSLANGYVVATGSKFPTYYKYESSTSRWLETGAPTGGYTGFSNMPIAIRKSTTWVVDQSAYEGRYAGDDDSNPAHQFMGSVGPFTGISAYQGRLVLLYGSRVSMSASNNPRRFYRSTVTTLLDADPIEVGAGSLSSAVFRYAVAFNKDLVLFGDKVQAVMPGNNAAITPRTASIMLTSAFDTGNTAPPVTTGQTMLYPTDRGGTFGFLEMLPSSSVDSIYSTLDVTTHLPTYFEGDCKFSTSSPVARMAVFGTTTNTKVLYVHEYLWDSDTTKAQSAWHKWEFQLDIASAVFVGSKLMVVFSNGVYANICVMDPRTPDPYENYLDNVSMYIFDPDAASYVVLGSRTTAFMAPENTLAAVDSAVYGSAYPIIPTRVLATFSGVLMTPHSYSSETMRVGWTYTSTVTPSPVVLRDRKQLPILTGTTTLHSLTLHTKDTGQYDAVVTYGDDEPSEVFTQGTEILSTPDVEADAYLQASESSSVIPCRFDRDKGSVSFTTAGTEGLTITGLDYIVRHRQKYRRG